MRSHTERKPRHLRIVHDVQTSEHKGVAGLYETLFRRFKTIVFIASVAPLYVIGIATLGASLVPGIMFVKFVNYYTQNMHWVAQNFGLGFSLAAAYILYTPVRSLTL